MLTEAWVRTRRLYLAGLLPPFAAYLRVSYASSDTGHLTALSVRKMNWCVWRASSLCVCDRCGMAICLSSEITSEDSGAVTSFRFRQNFSACQRHVHSPCRLLPAFFWLQKAVEPVLRTEWSKCVFQIPVCCVHVKRRIPVLCSTKMDKTYECPTSKNCLSLQEYKRRIIKNESLYLVQ